MDSLWVGGTGSTNLPDWLYRHLVTIMKVPPEDLVRLKCVQQVNFVAMTPVRLIRIFDPIKVPLDTPIKDFASLDMHPELILYEGYRELKTNHIRLMRKAAAH